MEKNTYYIISTNDNRYIAKYGRTYTECIGFAYVYSTFEQAQRVIKNVNEYNEKHDIPVRLTGIIQKDVIYTKVA